MRVVAWDTWAFVEVALGYRRKEVVQDLLVNAEVVVTARDIVGETYTFILGKTKNPARARQWLEAAKMSRIRIIDPSFESVYSFLEAHPEAHGLSWPDMALAYIADQSNAGTIATQDKGFQSLGFKTPFAIN